MEINLYQVWVLVANPGFQPVRAACHLGAHCSAMEGAFEAYDGPLLVAACLDAESSGVLYRGFNGF
jgi:hypothetical protein